MAALAGTNPSICCFNRSKPQVWARPAADKSGRIVGSPRWAPQQHRSASLAARSRLVAVAAAAARDAPSLQLATAKLPSDANKDVFVQQLYQWAATLTSNGRNLPFALPLKTDRLPDGFAISLLRVAKGGNVLSVADVVATVEAVPGTGDVLIVRLFEGEGADQVGLRRSANVAPEKRLQILLEACVDIPLIMQTMPSAIRQAAMVAR